MSSSLIDAPETVAIVGATILDGNGGTPLKDGVVVIGGSRILAVGDRSTQIPLRAKQIAASGKFLIPGLMSTATFLVDGAFLTTLVRYEERFDEVAIEAAQLALRGGVTTVFDPWGPRDALIKAREAIKQGRVVASRIYLAGNIVGYDGPFSLDFRYREEAGVPATLRARIDSQWVFNVGQALAQMAPEQVREQIRQYARSGIDFLSCGVNDHSYAGYYERSSRCLIFSPRVHQVIVEEAHRAGLPVFGFGVLNNEGLFQVVSAEVDLTIIGAAFQGISEETVGLIGRRQTPCVLEGNTAESREWFRKRGVKGEETVQGVDAIIRRLLDAGAVPLLVGTGGLHSKDQIDSWELNNHIPKKGYAKVGEGHIHHLQVMRENGVSPMGMLMAATRNVAKAYRVDKELGTLERGKLADLLILDKNPLEDVENYRSISVVMKEGKIIDRDALPTQRLIATPLPKS